MRFRILGPLEIFDGTQWRGISAAKPRALLATLLVRRDVPVPTERLVTELWGEREPRAAANLVQQYVLRLRRELDDKQGRLLVTRSPGYQVVPGDDGLDATVFARLGDSGHAALAAGEAERAAALLAEALALWRGPALTDVPAGPVVEAEAARQTNSGSTSSRPVSRRSWPAGGTPRSCRSSGSWCVSIRSGKASGSS